MLCPEKAKIHLKSVTWRFEDSDLVFVKISKLFFTIHCWQMGRGSLADRGQSAKCLLIRYWFSIYLHVFFLFYFYFDLYLLLTHGAKVDIGQSAKCLLIKYLSRAILPCCHFASMVQSIQTVSNLNIHIWKGRMI